MSLNNIDATVKKADKRKNSSTVRNVDAVEAEEIESQRQMKCAWPYHENRAKRVDLISRVLFPVSYLLFNIAYWVAYGYFII